MLCQSLHTVAFENRDTISSLKFAMLSFLCNGWQPADGCTNHTTALPVGAVVSS